MNQNIIDLTSKKYYLTDIISVEHAKFMTELFKLKIDGDIGYLDLFLQLNYNTEKIKQKNIILFLNYTDSIFSFSEQRSFISDLEKFFKKYYYGLNIQIILTTNSLIIPTDLLEMKLLYGKEQGKEKNKVYKTFIYDKKDQYLAANIHDVYYNHFINEKDSCLPIGNKIRNKINFLLKNKKEKEKNLKLINNLGEVFIRNGLLEDE